MYTTAPKVSVRAWHMRCDGNGGRVNFLKGRVKSRARGRTKTIMRLILAVKELTGIPSEKLNVVAGFRRFGSFSFSKSREPH